MMDKNGRIYSASDVDIGLEFPARIHFTNSKNGGYHSIALVGKRWNPSGPTTPYSPEEEDLVRKRVFEKYKDKLGDDKRRIVFGRPEIHDSPLEMIGEEYREFRITGKPSGSTIDQKLVRV